MSPPASTGTLSTEAYAGDSEIRIENVAAVSAEETNGYFEGIGSQWTATTKYLSYEPDYYEYENAPTLLFESSVVSNFYPASDNGTVIPLSEQVILDEETNTITLVALNGSLSRTQAGSVSVSPSALSASSESVAVESASGEAPFQITLPTKIPADRLEARTSLTDVTGIPGEERVRITLSSDEAYTLRTARVGVGSQTTNPGAAYLTLVDSSADSITVQVHDHFTNPVSGFDVNVSDPNPFQSSSQTTNSDGEATFTVSEGESGDATLSILDGVESYERVETPEFNPGEESRSNGSGAYNVSWVDATGAGVNDCTGTFSGCTVNANNGTTVTLTASVFESGEPLTGATVDFAHNNSTLAASGQFSMIPSENTTVSSGNSSTTLTVPEENGTVRVYAASGGDADPIDINVTTADQGATDPGMAFEDLDGDGVYEPEDGDFTVDLAANNYQYDATSTGPSASLVVPESVSIDAPQSVSLSGENVTLRGDTAARYDLSVTATQGDIRAAGTTLESGSQNSMTLSAQSGTVTVDNSVINAGGLELSGGVSGTGAEISTGLDATIGDGSGALSLTNAVIDTTAGSNSVSFAGTSLEATGLRTNTDGAIDASSVPEVTLTDADFDAAGSITIGSGNGDVRLDDSDFDTSTNSYGEVTVEGVQTTVRGTQIAAIGDISVTADGNPVEVTAGSALDTSAGGYGGVTITGSAATVTDSQVDAVGAITITGNSGSADVSGSTIDNSYNYAADITIESQATIDVRSATLRSDGAMSGQRGGPKETAYVQDASFFDGVNTPSEFDVSHGPNNIVGTPANGTVT